MSRAEDESALDAVDAARYGRDFAEVYDEIFPASTVPDGAAAWLATLAQAVVLLVTVLLSLALTFNLGPAARHRRVWVTPGTAAGAAAVLTFSYLFRLYVRYYASYDRAYGSLGGIMVLVFWYWVVGLVLLGAAEMDRAIEAAAPGAEAPGQGAPGAAGDPGAASGRQRLHAR